MDLSYILFNTLVYGMLAFVFSSFYAYSKIQHLWIWALMIFLWYIIHQFITYWIHREPIVALMVVTGFYLLTNWILIKQFPQEKTRDLLSIVFTLSISILLENVINVVYGPSSIALSWDVSLITMIIVFIILNILLFYFFWSTYYGKIMKGIYERVTTIRSLGINTSILLHSLFFVLFVLLWVTAFFILTEGNMKSTDAIFYLIKWIWIAILVGFTNKQYTFVGALLYVILEYLMFIELWRPIVYKETLILVLILIVLIFKPTWLFSRGQRHI